MPLSRKKIKKRKYQAKLKARQSLNPNYKPVHADLLAPAPDPTIGINPVSPFNLIVIAS